MRFWSKYLRNHLPSSGTNDVLFQRIHQKRNHPHVLIQVFSSIERSHAMKRTTRILGVMITASLLVLSLLGTMPIKTVKAAPLTYTVTSIADPGDGTCDITCTLRDAITAANANLNTGSETDTINFTVSGTISPSTPLPNINGNLVIDGTGQNIKISGNNARRVLYILAGTVTLNNLTIQNGSGSPYGGGVFNTGGILTVIDSTFTDNNAGYGGGIANLGSLTIANSTFYNNGATTYGGGVYNEGGTLTILNSTFSANGATTSGGGVYNQASSSMNLGNTILANSTSGGDCANTGTIGSNTNNLIRDGSCSPLIAEDPKLDVLADNGGSTQTMALLLGSPAREAGDSTICAAAPVNNLDQRGVTRPRGPQCDIGAYEAVYASAINIDPNPLNFGEQAISTTSAVKNVVLTYMGTGTIQIGTLSITGDFAFFGPNICSGATLIANSQCTFGVVFSPTVTGTRTGVVSIPSTAYSSPDSLALVGIGINPVVGLSATSLVFAPQYADTTSLSKVVTITNIGTGTLVIGTLYTSGDFLVHSNTCNGARLPAAGTCKFRVAFTPFSSGISTGVISIPSNATTSPNKVTLRGTTKEGIQLLKMGNFDTVVRPIPWVVSSPQENLARIRDCYSFRSPFCSAKFIGSSKNYILSAVQMVTHTGNAGDRYYLGLSSRASKVPLGGQYKLIVSFLGTSGVVGSKTFLFTNGTHAYQAIGQIYTVPAAYTRIHFNFTYQKTGGTAWFDDALLILLP
jgi:CSLREA domain-containing protein